MSRLLAETSPYLLQHAHNPVDWFPWGPEALQKAEKENKLIIVSIGYSACHWCHVMEKESFMNHDIADLMNEHFVCIKVDREERPDIDMIYMHAVQLIQGQGGWPLNVFCLPDGSPFFGGTYFRKEAWTSILLNASRIYKENPEQLQSHADSIKEGLNTENIFHGDGQGKMVTPEMLTRTVNEFKSQFDYTEGGFSGAPKFPMPANLSFLVQYFHRTKDGEVLKFVETSLTKMAMGGIYDHLGGGFARYSTDVLWKVPHFEKMLYDNAQLISLYTEAWKITGNKLYKDIVYETMDFVKNELLSPEHMFFSALDADSEGKEGWFYTWTKDEIENILGEDADLFSFYYEVGAAGQWDDGRNILLRNQDLETLVEQHGFNFETVSEIMDEARRKLLETRNRRIRPALDHKVLTSWNALMIKACFDAFKAFREPGFLEMGQQALDALLKNMLLDGHKLLHRYAKGQAGIPGFLEDYANLAAALLAHPNDPDQKYLSMAFSLINETLTQFYDEKSGMCWFTSNDGEKLISRKMELTDNVIPSSNSVMSKVLHTLGQVYSDHNFLDVSKRMMQNISEKSLRYPGSFANLNILLMEQQHPFYVTAIIGDNSYTLAGQMQLNLLPNTHILYSEKGNPEFEYLHNRYTEGKTLIHVCTEGACLLPTEDLAEALKVIQS
jgi:uncharacterized protein YyaL (SSP411 family)